MKLWFGHASQRKVTNSIGQIPELEKKEAKPDVLQLFSMFWNPLLNEYSPKMIKDGFP